MLRIGRIHVVWLAAAVTAALATDARANSFTGDPNADGWHFNGNSLALGTFVRLNPAATSSVDKLFNFEVHPTKAYFASCIARILSLKNS